MSPIERVRRRFAPRRYNYLDIAVATISIDIGPFVAAMKRAVDELAGTLYRLDTAGATTGQRLRELLFRSYATRCGERVCSRSHVDLTGRCLSCGAEQ